MNCREGQKATRVKGEAKRVLTQSHLISPSNLSSYERTLGIRNQSTPMKPNRYEVPTAPILSSISSGTDRQVITWKIIFSLFF